MVGHSISASGRSIFMVGIMFYVAVEDMTQISTYKQHDKSALFKYAVITLVLV